MLLPPPGASDETTVRPYLTLLCGLLKLPDAKWERTSNCIEGSLQYHKPPPLCLKTVIHMVSFTLHFTLLLFTLQFRTDGSTSVLNSKMWTLAWFRCRVLSCLDGSSMLCHMFVEQLFGFTPLHSLTCVCELLSLGWTTNCLRVGLDLKSTVMSCLEKILWGFSNKPDLNVLLFAILSLPSWCLTFSIYLHLFDEGLVGTTTRFKSFLSMCAL